MSVACSYIVFSRCMAFSWASQLLWSAIVSNCWWNTVQDVDPSNFHGFTLTVLVPVFPPPPHLVWAFTVTIYISNFQCRSSRSCWVMSPAAHYWPREYSGPAPEPLPWCLSAVSLHVCYCLLEFILGSLYVTYITFKFLFGKLPVDLGWHHSPFEVHLG
jgi:hypothetical protein